MKAFRTLSTFVFVWLPMSAFALTPPTIVFSDVPYQSWYSEELYDALFLGIVSGYQDASGRPTGFFGPGAPVTVGEALKISMESAGMDVNNGVGFGHWAAKYMSVAIGENFQLTKVPNLNLDRPATRAEVSSLIVDSFSQSYNTSVSGKFSDVTAVTPYAGSIEELAKDGVITGDTTSAGVLLGTFRPQGQIVRAEMVKMAMGARKIYTGVSSSTESLTSSNISVCKVVDCGPAPQMPNWQCPDGSIAGPSCEKLPDNRCGWLIRQCPSISSSFSSSRSSSRISSSSSNSSRIVQTFTITYKDTGFQPSFLAIHVGDTIKFRNESTHGMWVASNPHPTHGDYPEFDQDKSVGAGSQYTFKFTKVGTWGFHNHDNSSHQGVITVDP